MYEHYYKKKHIPISNIYQKPYNSFNDSEYYRTQLEKIESKYQNERDISTEEIESPSNDNLLMKLGVNYKNDTSRLLHIKYKMNYFYLFPALYLLSMIPLYAYVTIKYNKLNKSNHNDSN
ncbi:hypothetical protein MKS88_003491 [Plasmodium brasilianum]|uniref:Uncharacterized protein n=1 Tax=Plasmodium brasilianum TaxID=5824 RepID=A0ACB9Y7L8_PLABR|nr:hypothetical protein MKS88_003491 [Plasmodium brasilianum]